MERAGWQWNWFSLLSTAGIRGVCAGSTIMTVSFVSQYLLAIRVDSIALIAISSFLSGPFGVITADPKTSHPQVQTITDSRTEESWPRTALSTTRSGAPAQGRGSVWMRRKGAMIVSASRTRRNTAPNSSRVCIDSFTDERLFNNINYRVHCCAFKFMVLS